MTQGICLKGDVVFEQFGRLISSVVLRTCCFCSVKSVKLGMSQQNLINLRTARLIQRLRETVKRNQIFQLHNHIIDHIHIEGRIWELTILREEPNGFWCNYSTVGFSIFKVFTLDEMQRLVTRV